MEHTLTTGNVSHKLLGFAIPIFFANLLQALYGTVDLMIVGLFADPSAVSAVSTGSMTMQTITGVIAGMTMGSTVLLGQNIGKKDQKAASRTVASAAVLFGILGILFAILTPLFSSPIAKLMNAPTEAFSQTVSYICICGGGIIFIIFFNAISGMLRGTGNSKTPLALVGIACFCNILGDLLLVGRFHMGSNGAAVATVIAQAISVLCAGIYFKRNGLGFETARHELHPAKYELTKILTYGLPIAAQEALTGISFMVILAILNSFGLIASAGVGVAEKICALIFIVPGAMMSAVSAFSAQNVGAGNPHRARQAMFVSMITTVGVGIIMFLISFTNGVWISHFFSQNMEVCKASADYLRSYAIDCVIVGINFSMMGYLNGNGQTGFVALQGILSTFLVRIPFSYGMSKIPEVSLFQVGFATPLATLFAIVITTIYLLHFEKKQKETNRSAL